MKNILATLLLVLFCSCSSLRDRSEISLGYPIQHIEMNHVKLSDSFWQPRIKQIQQEVIAHAFDKCAQEGRLDNYVAAHNTMNGVPGEARGTMPFDDSDIYKILEGASYSLVSFPNEKLDAYCDSVIAIIALGQEADGYITTWRTINPDKPTSEWVPGGPRWSNLEISHELYNSGHLFEAAAVHYSVTGKTNFLDIALKNADLLVSVFGDDGMNAVPGHQIVETGLIKLYSLTGREDYLQLAHKFLDLRGDSTKREIWGARNIQDHKPVLHESEAVGHAVRAVYMYAGMTDIAAAYKDAEYMKAINLLWENMVNKKMYVTGGIGARHHLEEFGDNYELPNLTAYGETCAAIGSVLWNERMFRLSGDAKYYDIIERTLYNGLISGISLDGTHFFYPNPLESDGEFAFNKGVCTREEWFDCSCCPTNLIRFIPYVPNLIYAAKRRDLYVNLFMANEAVVPLDSKNVHVRQITNYPWSNQVVLSVSPERETRFNLKLRIPGWAMNKPVPGSLYAYINPPAGRFILKVNGVPIIAEPENGYVEINRKWIPGDIVTLELPMAVRQIAAHPSVESLYNRVALEYGPIVYCAEQLDNPAGLDKISIASDDNYTVSMLSDMLGGVNVIEKHSQKGDNLFIPYYAWANRGVDKMKVWFERE